MVAGQIGMALRNAMLYEQERRRTVELSGLANLAQAVTAIREPQELFARLVESVAPLFDVEVVGFLLYDENKRTLEGQVPFRGLPPHIVQIYRASDRCETGRLTNCFVNISPFLTMNAAEDESWRTLGLDRYCRCGQPAGFGADAVGFGREDGWLSAAFPSRPGVR